MNIVAFPQKHHKNQDVITFSRVELDGLLRVYGFGVAQGEWRDYAIDFLKDRSIFSIFKRSQEMALYKIEKQPKLANKQGAFIVYNQTGMILKRGKTIESVLNIFDKQLKLIK